MPIRPAVSLRASIVTLVAVAAFTCVVVAALHTSTGQELDQRAMTSVVALRGAETTLLSLLGRVSVGAVLAVAAICVVVALIRRHIAAALAALVVLIGANLTTQLLKRFILERPDFGLGTYPSLPSGHTTVVAAATAALIIVVPFGWRATVASLGSFATTLTAISTIPPGWHRPSDVVAACLVVVAWTGIATVLLEGTSARPVGALAGAFAGAFVAAAGLVLVGVRPMGGWSGLGDAVIVMAVVVTGIAVSVWAIVSVVPTVDQP